ncbi:MAG: hypothetical protein AAFR47_17890 [Pseudomonadota bacterium]
MRVIDAARIMQAGYAPQGRLSVARSLNRAGVQAHLLTDGTLVVPGTNEHMDWVSFNLRVRPRMSSVLASVLRSGASGARWHSGFLTHAEILFDWARPHRPRRIIGHSLGAASAQIVGASLKIPTIGFAAPRTKHGSTRFAGEGWVLNVNRTDDLVAWQPPRGFGFRHIGSLFALRPPQTNPGGDHKMKFYIQLLQHPVAGARVPKVWPPRR